MNEMYGHRWASQQGDEPNDTWVKGCAGLTNIQLGAGLRACLDRDDGWPPTLPEFRQLCIGVAGSRSWETQCHKIYQPAQLLEDKTAKEKRQAEGLKQIKSLKAMLN